MAVVSYANDIAPLFAPTDIACMAKRQVMLADYNYMSVPENAQDVANHLDGSARPIMPPGQPWTADKIALFKAWIAGGYQP